MISQGSEAWYSIDTGEHASVFSPHYFDLNENHLNQNLMKMVLKEDDLKSLKVDIMTLNYGINEDL